jgi:hypothetical protein
MYMKHYLYKRIKILYKIFDIIEKCIVSMRF